MSFEAYDFNPLFDINGDGEQDAAEQFLEYQAYLDATGQNDDDDEDA